ncbi:MAG: hypothetical protein KGI51_04860 [Rhodospirillales bacterium]|nr:hypothetical protein [Rhodospirillales bacterium]
MEKRQATAGDWVDLIESRIELGREWRRRLADHKELASASRYVRILGRTFRPVSISDRNPCGHLRHKDKDREIEGRRDLEKIVAETRSATSGEPKAGKPEHGVQAFLIRAAMQKELRFGANLSGFSDLFEELIFITDEFSLDNGKVRADIVALARKPQQQRQDARFFPVFIELKAKRTLTTVLKQLRNAHDLLWKNERARRAFVQFLSAVSGVPTDQIDQNPEAPRRMVIWPKSSSGEEVPEVEAARKDGFLFVEFVFVASARPPYTFSRSTSPRPRIDGE